MSGTDTDLQGLAPIWLLGLALVLGSFITIFAPTVASPDHVKLSDWFGFAGSFAGAMVTLAAAAWAWSAVQGQIGQAENAIEAARAKEEFASRAVLPFALSSLHTYVARVIKQLAALPSPLGHDEKLVAAELPMDDVDAIRRRHMVAMAVTATSLTRHSNRHRGDADPTLSAGQFESRDYRVTRSIRRPRPCFFVTARKALVAHRCDFVDREI